MQIGNYKAAKAFAIFVALIFISGCSLNGKKVYQTEQGALRGFDPVAYFVEQKAVPGVAKYRSVDSNGTWYFSSAENKQRFDQSPEQYLPQYGGYCAYAMSFGLVVSSDPYAFSIIEDKLYLNYSLKVRDKWLKKTPQYIQQADHHWLKKI